MAVHSTSDEHRELPAARISEAAPPPPQATFSSYAHDMWRKIITGESGVLPVVVGLVVIGILFQSANSNFLSPGNLVNLLVQGSVFMLLAMGEVFALLLGEIDLSIGFVAGISGIIAAELVKGTIGWPVWLALLVALLVATAIGALQGTIITRLGLPSFVVTLAGLLAWQGVMLMILGNGGTLPINDAFFNGIANASIPPLWGWLVMGIAVAVYGLLIWSREHRRRTSGLVAPPSSVTWIKIGGIAAAGIALLLIANANRGILFPIEGLPWVVLLVLAVLALWSFLLGRTAYGRYVYAVGGNAEAARRAGIGLANIRTIAFACSGFTAGIAGIVYASRLQSVSTNLDGGQLVLYAVAAAVIGGTSLFGGHGKALHAVLGGIVIAAIYNGMGLLGLSAALQYVVTALVLLAAVTVDSVARRGKSH